MGQGEILNALEKHGGWMHTSEIVHEINSGSRCVLKSLSRMLKFNEVEKEGVGNGRNGGVYWRIKENK